MPHSQPAVAWQEPPVSLWEKIGSSDAAAERHGTMHADGVPIPTNSLSLRTDTSMEDRRPPRMLSGPQTPGFNYSVWLMRRFSEASSYTQGTRRR